MNNYLITRPEEWFTVVTRVFGGKCLNVTFQVTEDCCMACTYCYQHYKTNHKMDFNTAKILIDKILQEEPSKYATVIFEFIGGEPLLEVELIGEILHYTIHRMVEMHHPWLVCFKASICTNGYLYMTPKVQKFLHKYAKFLSLTVSVDGNQELHDKCRLDLSGKGTYEKAISAVKHFRTYYGNIYDTKMTISPENINYLYDAIINLIQEGFLHIYVNCIFEEGWNTEHAKILYKELTRLGDYVIQHNLYNKVFIRFFDEDLYRPMGEDENTNWCGGICSDNYPGFAIDYKGNKYPCIRYMSSSLNNKQPPLNIGNIYTDILNEEEQQHITLLSNITRRSQSTDKCFYCPIAKGCAWCSGYNYEQFGTPNKRATYTCEMHQAAALANAYFLNKLYRHLDSPARFTMYIPKEWALNIVSADEYSHLVNLSQE